jgi:hypothetical protein
MNHKEFLLKLGEFLESINQETVKKNTSIQFADYTYVNKPEISYGSPTGGWDANTFAGYRFVNVRQTYDFIIRPVNEKGYLVIESVSSQSQLANLDLSKSTKYAVKGSVGFLYEDYTMTVGLGRRSNSEIKKLFKEFNFDPDGTIALFNIHDIDFNSLLVDILKWAEIRQEVKYEIQKKNNESKKATSNSTANEEKEDITPNSALSGKNFTIRDKRDIDPQLGISSIANKLAKQIETLEDEEGQVIGIFGRWGRGKTFLINQILSNLGFDANRENQIYSKTMNFYFVKIHAWKYNEDNAFWAYLYETAAEEYYKASRFPKLNYVFRIIWLNLFRLGWLKSLVLILPFVLSLIWWKMSLQSKLDLIGWFISAELKVDNFSNVKNAIITLSPLLLSTFLFLKNVLPKASKLFTTITKKHSFKDELGFQAKVQDEFKTLLKAWIRKKANKKRILIVVDDLDRCPIDKIVPIADALRIILEDKEIIKRTVVITLVDEKILRYAIEKKYETINSKSLDIEDEFRTKEYMDKLFLTGIKLPNLLSEEKIAILDEITKNHVYVLEDEKVETKTNQKAYVPFTDLLGIKSNIDVKVVQNQNSNEEIHYLTVNEKLKLQSTILELENPTPRQIKIFYYRYLMLKWIDEADNFNIRQLIDEDTFVSITCLLLLSKHLPKQTTESKHFKDRLRTEKEKISDAYFIKLEVLIDMVVPY